jgi:hypothetical protein
MFLLKCPIFFAAYVCIVVAHIKKKIILKSLTINLLAPSILSVIPADIKQLGHLKNQAH